MTNSIFTSMKKIILATLLTLIPLFGYSQTEIGIETQVYPTGIIPGVRIDQFVGDKTSLSLRFGYQIIDHRDLGVHDDETGSGYGLSLGAHFYQDTSTIGWHIGPRVDLWRNSIDWSDGSAATMITGETDVTVLQPTVVGGYRFAMGLNGYISPTIGFGYEWNVKTEGEPTGEGAILLLGVQLAFRI